MVVMRCNMSLISMRVFITGHSFIFHLVCVVIIDESFNSEIWDVG